MPVHYAYYSSSYRRRSWVIRWLINTVALLVTAALLGGVEVSGILAALVAAAGMGVVNAFIRPIFLILTLPLNLLTLGLFTFVLNGLMLLLVAALVPGFVLHGLGAAILGALLLSLISSLISWVVGA